MEVKQKEKQKKNISCVLFEERYTHNNKHSTARRANTSFDQNASNQNINNTSGEKKEEKERQRERERDDQSASKSGKRKWRNHLQLMFLVRASSQRSV